MNIITLFCEIDDFFLAHEKWKPATQSLPRETLRQQGVDLVYKVRKNMKPRFPLSVSDEVLLKKRMLIESVIRVLKTQTQLEHTPHRNLVNFQVNVVSETLIAYQLLENKSSLNLAELQEINDLPMLF